MEFDSDILIVGGGLNGCTQAIALARHGFTVTLIDAQPLPMKRDPAFDGRSYALALTSVRLLDRLSLWSDLKSNAQPMLDVKVTDGRAGEGASLLMMHFDHHETGEGPLGHMVEDRHIRRVLLDAIKADANITHLSAQTVVDQNLDMHASVTLASGQNLTGRLLIGCDGRNSATAQRAGIKRQGWDYDQSSVVCAVAHEKPHDGVAHQFFMPSGPLAILPLQSNKSAIVWSQPHDVAQQLVAGTEAAFLDALRPAFGSFLGQIYLAGGRYAIPLSHSIAEQFTGHRMVLVGDSAHGIHPLAGQGLNAGFRDTAALTEVLVNARRRGQDIGSDVTLADYAQWRRFDIATLGAATDTFNRLFSNDNSLLRAARVIGMGFVGSVPALRKRIIREAAGLTGDIPRLMQGKAI